MDQIPFEVKALVKTLTEAATAADQRAARAEDELRSLQSQFTEQTLNFNPLLST